MCPAPIRDPMSAVKLLLPPGSDCGYSQKQNSFIKEVSA